MNVIEALIEGIKANGTEPPRTPEDFEKDAIRIIHALGLAGYNIVEGAPHTSWSCQMAEAMNRGI